jgi:hypothetical protein
MRPSPSLGGLAHVCAVLFSEYQRAVAMECRYEALRRTAPHELAKDGIAKMDIARRIFEEFYCGSGRQL